MGCWCGPNYTQAQRAHAGHWDCTQGGCWDGGMWVRVLLTPAHSLVLGSHKCGSLPGLEASCPPLTFEVGSNPGIIP